MKTDIEILKGIHPGKYLERKLEENKLNKRQFAFSVHEHPQTLGSIIHGKRRMNVELSLQIEEKLNIEQGFLMTLQVFYDIKQVLKNKSEKPNLTKFNKALFWDTDFENIDWELQKKAVINRVFTRGNEEEKEEIIRFYGIEVVNKMMNLNRQKL